MTPAVQRALAFTGQHLRRLGAAARQHPVRAAMVLPALVVLYLLLLLPFTPGIGNLRKAKAETPSVLLASDGSVLAEYKRINR
ncbi:MAG: glycosyl transferase, partial [Polaromonas sp.]